MVNLTSGAPDSARDLAEWAAERGIGNLLPLVIDDHSARIEESRYDGDFSNIYSATAGMSHVVHAAESRGLDASVLRAALAQARHRRPLPAD